MRVRHDFSSPNFSPIEIPVDFIVLHYTAADLQRTLEIFADPARKVCAHFVLDQDGTVYDLGQFLNGPVLQGAHAGESRVNLAGREYTALNKMSVGIEIVNLNGNLFDYSEAQYSSLTELLKHLLKRFPKTATPGHILGHEHIAGFRGKCDPGIRFNWRRVLTALGLAMTEMHQQSVFSDDDRGFAEQFCAARSNMSPQDWSLLSSTLEQRIKTRPRPR